MAEQIFIASNGFDVGHVAPVAQLLEQRGFDVINYQADFVSIGRIPLSAVIDPQDGLRITYGGHDLRLSDIGAAWSRRPKSFGPSVSGEDRGKRMSLDGEWAASQQVIFDAIPENRWLNSPIAMRQAGNMHKLNQLVLARTVGFTIPTTVVSNEWSTIKEELPQGPIIYKGFNGDLYEDNTVKAVHTTVLSNPDRLPAEELLPLPGIWQDYQPKLREWRITLIGDHSFDVAIYTDEAARDDWRLHQNTPNVTFEVGKFPDQQKAMCYDLLRRYGLRFGAFDFVELPDGTIVFLEMNPNGQYAWLEYLLGFPMAAAMASELERIAAA